MLKTNVIQNGDVVSLKLASGDEIIGKVVAQGEDVITLSKPHVIGASQQGIGLIPYMFGADDDSQVPFSRAHIVTMIRTREELKLGYIQQTSGLAMPPASSSIITP